jgi:uncharacterized protein (TIGR02246 family)
MTRFAILAAALLLSAVARADDQDARRMAQETLDKGASLFDARDAAGLAASYTEDAELTAVFKEQGAGAFKTQVVRGRDAIEKAYQNLFKDGRGATKSRNRVEYAHFVGSDLLIIHGQFQPDTNQENQIPFVQVRTKKEDRWLMMNLQLFIVSEQ